MSIKFTILEANKFTAMQQVAYIPNHVRESSETFDQAICHPDVQFGWVTSINLKTDTVFCRYWIQGKEGEVVRTRSVSEGCDASFLIRWNSVLNAQVYDAMDIIDREDRKFRADIERSFK